MSNLLEGALRDMEPNVRDRFLEHLDGGSSCNWLSDWLARFGRPISPTTLKAYRAQRRQERR